jgi:gamma-tubulin complex component 3
MDFTDKREGDLDALIAAHRTYLDRVVRKVLLLGSKRDKQVSSISHFVGVKLTR